MLDENNKEYYLENVLEKNKLYPRTFLIPTQSEINSLNVYTTVRLIFVMQNQHENGYRAEKMWVIITDIQRDTFTGILENQPYYLKSINYGDEITFNRENIAVIKNVLAFNENLFAIITKKAIEKQQINRVMRTDDLNNDRDSGWQLFYGDESKDYLNDPKNLTLIKLEQVLKFEPLLETVFSGSGYSYEYSIDNNQFIEVL